MRAVGAVNVLPLTGLGMGATFSRWKGVPLPGVGQRPQVLLRSVTPSYFSRHGNSARGRAGFWPLPIPRNRRPWCVVNQTLARRFWPGANRHRRPHRHRSAGAGLAAEVVGVVGDVKPDQMDGEDWPTIYGPYAQGPSLRHDAGRAHRGAAPGPGLGRAPVKYTSSTPTSRWRTFAPWKTWWTWPWPERASTPPLLASFAVIAFLLAAVGIYGVISYDVSQRTNEIGIRMALGAQPEDVRRMILGQGARLAVYGIVAGLMGAGILTRWMGSMLFGVSPTDVVT